MFRCFFLSEAGSKPYRIWVSHRGFKAHGAAWLGGHEMILAARKQTFSAVDLRVYDDIPLKGDVLLRSQAS